MVSFQPAAYPQQKSHESYSSFSYAKQQQEVSTETGSTQTSVVQIRYESRSSHTYAPNGVEKYQAIGDKQPISAASNILTFIEAQIQRDVADGATPEELASRLQAGLDGFLKGFNEAYEQIAAMGMLVDGVGSAVQKTYDDVISGIAAIAEKFGIEPPEGMRDTGETQSQTAPVESPKTLATGKSGETSSSDESDKQIINSFVEQQRSYLSESKESASVAAEGQLRRYEFQVKTRDGDVVTINASSAWAGALAANENGVGYAGYGEDFFNFSVSGELDEDELNAINDLLKQVNDVADVFFNGDVYAAFEKALEIGFDDEELVQYSFSMLQVQVKQVENTYKDVQENGEYSPAKYPANRVAVIGEFVQKLEILEKGLAEMGVNFEIAQNLFDLIADDMKDQHPNGEKIGELARRVHEYL